MTTALARNAAGVLAMSNRLRLSNIGAWGSKLPGFTGRPAISTASWTVSPLTAAGSRKVIVLTPSVTADTVSRNRDLLAIGRFGVGYDAVDVEACTQADVVVFITAGAVDRSVAEATVGWMIALTHQMRIKDRLVRMGRWDERSKYMGRELRDRTFGAIGFGGIGRAARSRWIEHSRRLLRRQRRDVHAADVYQRGRVC